MINRTVTTRQLGVHLAPVPATTSPAANPPAQPAPAQTSARSMGVGQQVGVAAAGFAAVIVAWFVAVNAIKDSGFIASAAPTAPVEGLTIFAVFFVAAAGLERLLEPLTSIVSNSKKADLQSSLKVAADALKAWQEATNAWAEETDATTKAQKKTAADAAAKLADEKMKVAAQAQGTVSTASWVMSVAAWAVASALGILAAAVLKLYLLHRVGIAAPDRKWELLATGLIIGAGTKPLHDLVGYIEAKKEQQQQTSTAGTSGT